jgi:LCP family protein required for cell wall assembly
MILLRLRRHSADAVWFPRDLLVQIPGQAGLLPLNQAYSIGGPGLAIDTFKANFGVDVNHYVELDMRGLSDLVDALGGIHISFAEALRDDNAGLHVGAGCVRLDGDATLALVRSRNAQAFRDGSWQFVDVRSDLSREERQQQVVDAIATAVRAQVDRHPQRLVGLLDAFVRHVKTDDTFRNGELLRLSRVLVGLDSAHVSLTTLPVTESPTDPNHLVADSESDATLRRLGGSVTTAAATPSTAAPIAVAEGEPLSPC